MLAKGFGPGLTMRTNDGDLAQVGFALLRDLNPSRDTSERVAEQGVAGEVARRDPAPIRTNYPGLKSWADIERSCRGAQNIARWIQVAQEREPTCAKSPICIEPTDNRQLKTENLAPKGR
jgi:hypothetical protein